MARVAETVVKN